MGPSTLRGMHIESRTTVQLIHDIAHSHRVKTQNEFHRLMHPVVAGFTPASLTDYLKQGEQLVKVLEKRLKVPGGGPFEVDDSRIPWLRHAVIATRLRVARELEVRRQQTIHPELLEKLDHDLRPYDALVASEWFQRAKVIEVPLLTDYFPVELIEAQLAKERGAERSREYDEKFRILQAPGLFHHDLDRARTAAALRGVLLAVVYLDIDKFKDFNTENGEPYVDRFVLPKFMRAIEAHVFTRGYAYRYGGDEYVILLNNVTEEEALASMNRLRERLGTISYEGTQRRTTVSIGVVTVRPDCHLTDQEIETAAAAAKQYAKAQGRDRVATYNSPMFVPNDLRIAASPAT